MYPPSMGYGLDIAAISGILGSISIACWVVVFSPQIIENYSKKSADGLSIEFIIIWLGMWYSRCSNCRHEADKLSNSWRFLQHGRRRSSGNHAYNGMNSCILGQRVLLIITRLSLPSTTLSLILSCSFNASTTEGSPSVTRNRTAKLPTLRMAMRQSVRLLWTTPMPVLVMSSRELLVVPMLTAPPTAHALSQLTANISTTSTELCCLLLLPCTPRPMS